MRSALLLLQPALRLGRDRRRLAGLIPVQQAPPRSTTDPAGPVNRSADLRVRSLAMTDTINASDASDATKAEGTWSTAPRASIEGNA
jgi:hypothetical protein